MTAGQVIDGLSARAVACPAAAIFLAAPRPLMPARSDAGDAADDGAVAVMMAGGTIVRRELGPVGIPPLGQP